MNLSPPILLTLWQKKQIGIESKRMNKEDFLVSGLLEKYVLGLATLEEREVVERFVKQYPDIQVELEALQQAMGDYAETQAELPPKRKKAAPSRLWWLTAPAFLALGFVSLWEYRQWGLATEQIARLSAEYATLQQRCAQTQARHEEIARLHAFVHHRHTRAVYLHGTAVSPEAIAIVYWNKEARRAFCNPGSLPAPPPGKQYQIWADVKGEMIHIGLLSHPGDDMQTIRFIDHAKSLNITLEPTGGSKHPTVELLYVNSDV
jgi:anti-sigma-K factor RskA